MPYPYKPWWTAEDGEVHKIVREYVAEVERRQTDTFDRFIKLEALYDPNTASSAGSRGGDSLGLVTENVVASNVDTVTAAVAATDVRARFMTDDGDWSEQRQARHLEWYAEGLQKLLVVPEKCRAGFKASAKKGNGLNKVFVNRFDQIRIEPTLVDDIIADDLETRNGGAPKQLHQRWPNADREELKAMFPDKADEIDRAHSGGYRGARANVWGSDRRNDNELLVVESWRLPIGTQGHERYKPGRHTITIEGCDLFDEEWNKAFFPFAVIRWSEREGSWYGISLSERIAGHQRALNKRNWQIDRQLDQGAVPTTYVRVADANLAVKTTSRLGTVAVYKADMPHTVIPPAVSGETYAHRETLKASAFEESGISRMAAQSMKPAGLDSGVALREYRDQTTQRFSIQEKAYEQFVLDTVWLALECCKELGAAAPVVMRRTRFGAKRIEWGDVDMSDLRVQIAAASTLSRTPAGRTQTVLEWAQAGVISQDEARRLMRHPDLERAMSLYTAAIEGTEHAFEMIEDGEVIMPEPFDNLEMIVKRGQLRYEVDRDNGAPEEILEGLRQYVVQAAHMLTMQAPANSNVMPMAPEVGAMPVDPMALPPPMPVAPPQAALAPEAMNLRAV